MKKIVIFALFCLTLCINGNLKAQNCEAILRPYFILNGYSSDEYPQEKAEWRCAFSYSAFYLCDNIPANAKVYSFSELTNKLTKQHPSANYSVDLETLSYYEFDFKKTTWVKPYTLELADKKDTLPSALITTPAYAQTNQNNPPIRNNISMQFILFSNNNSHIS